MVDMLLQTPHTTHTISAETGYAHLGDFAPFCITYGQGWCLA